MACGQQKVKGGHGSITASSSASCSASIITLNLGVGCAPSCWPIFGFRNLLGARRGAEGSFLCSPSSRFSGGGGGVGSPPGRGGEWGCHGYWRSHRVSPRHTRKRTPAQYSPPFFLLA